MSEIDIEKSGGVAMVTLNRPPVNSLTLALCEHISEAFEGLGTSNDVNCVVFTGAGTRAFCAGFDFQEFLEAKPEETSKRTLATRRMYSSIYNCAVPVIAAVNGPALGAGSVLASVCDIRMASETARFGMPEINVGRCGGAAHHGRLLPQGVVRRMFFTGQPISAVEAYRIGFLEQVLPTGELISAAREMAAVIASKSPVGLRCGKKALNEIEDLPFEQGYAVEQAYTEKLRDTEDAKEARRAVMEKRSPVFTGR